LLREGSGRYTQVLIALHGAQLVECYKRPQLLVYS
jgi:hypothetical protein